MHKFQAFSLLLSLFLASCSVSQVDSTGESKLSLVNDPSFCRVFIDESMICSQNFPVLHRGETVFVTPNSKTARAELVQEMIAQGFCSEFKAETVITDSYGFTNITDDPEACRTWGR